MRGALAGLLLLGLLGCGRQTGESAPATPVGTYRVANVAEAVARAHAHGVEAMNDVIRALGKGVTPEDERVGYEALREVDAELTERLQKARVELLADRTVTWTPAPVIGDKLPMKVMTGHWTLVDRSVTFALERLDEFALPWKVEIAATWVGDDLRFGLLTGRLANTGLEGVVLHRGAP